MSVPSRNDFLNALRFELLGMMAECLINKKEGKELGMELELKRQKIHKLLGDAYDMLVPPEAPIPKEPPKANAAGQTQPRK